MKRFVIMLAVFMALPAQAQVVRSFNHTNKVKEVETLAWFGEYEGLPSYVSWWGEVSACSEIALPPGQRTDSVRYFFVNAPDFRPIPTDKLTTMVAAVTYAAYEQIYVAVRDIKNKSRIKHEMLHQLLYWWGDEHWDDDQNPAFKKCGL